MDLKHRLQRCLGPSIMALSECRGDVCVEVSKEDVLEVLGALKNDPDLRFDFLSDLFGIDNSAYSPPKKKKKTEEEEGEQDVGPEPPPLPRYEVNYLLLSLKSNERVQVKVRLAEAAPELDSATSIWKAATWPEREAFDMFGIRFKGHPGLRRLLMWDGFPDHPLRKDYPLEGRDEERRLVYDE